MMCLKNGAQKSRKCSKMRKKIIILVIASLILTSWAVPFGKTVKLRGGEFPTKSMAIWELEKFKYTTLLRAEPLCWCPFESYVAVDECVEVVNKNNQNYLVIKKDLVKLTSASATYNKKYAPTFTGTDREKILKMYRYLRKTKYVLHVKKAKNVFKDREGDCAAMSEALYVMCKKNGIQVRYIIGWAEGVCHAWNRVKIGNKWYYIDTAMGRYLCEKLYDGYTIMEYW